jgi:DNA modification methylase
MTTKTGKPPIENGQAPAGGDAAGDAEKEQRQRQQSFNGLSAREWAAHGRNVWNDVSSPRQAKHLAHGATFSVKLATRLIEMYSRVGDWVLDPFLGTGTTLEACRETGRHGIGIELNEKFLPESQAICEQPPLIEGTQLEVIHGDCRNLLEHVAPAQIQLVVTSPPYANFIQKSEEDRRKTHKQSKIVLDNRSKAKHYSDRSEDFGNLPYEDFLAGIEALMEALRIATKPGGYNVWVVKDARDTQHGIPYVPLHADLARVGEHAGFKWHDLIVWDQNERRKLVLLGYPSVFYTNQNCSFLVVLRKPAE